MCLPVDSTTTFRKDVCVRVYTLCLVISLMLLCLPTALTSRVCKNEDIPKMQQACKRENQDFRSANENDDHVQICKRLYDMWFCVARSVPQCFANYTIFYQSYLHSPHDCRPTQTQFEELQRIRNEGLDNVDVITLDTTTQSFTTTHSGGGGGETDRHGNKSTESVNRGEEEEKEKEEKEEKEEEGSEHSGHKGTNTGSSIKNRSVILLFFISMVTVLLTSGGQ